MALNFLEQLVAEWYEFRGYFVRRKINVGPSLKGKFEFELDIVAFHPGKPHLVHIEPSMDATSWDQREKRYTAKFGAGKKHIPSLFSGFDLPEIDQIALLVFAGKLRVPTLGGGKVLLIQDFMNEIRSDAEWGLATRSVRNRSVPEQYVILRSLQFATNYWITDNCVTSTREPNALASNGASPAVGRTPGCILDHLGVPSMVPPAGVPEFAGRLSELIAQDWRR